MTSIQVIMPFLISTFHLGMRYYTDTNNGMVMSKVKKTMSIDDISKELDDAVILVEESEVMRYHKRLTQLGNYMLHTKMFKTMDTRSTFNKEVMTNNGD